MTHLDVAVVFQDELTILRAAAQFSLNHAGIITVAGMVADLEAVSFFILRFIHVERADHRIRRLDAVRRFHLRSVSEDLLFSFEFLIRQILILSIPVSLRIQRDDALRAGKYIIDGNAVEDPAVIP